MLVPIAALLIVLIAAFIGAVVVAKRRWVDHVPPPPDLPYEHHPMTSHMDLTNPGTPHPDELRQIPHDTRP